MSATARVDPVVADFLDRIEGIRPTIDRLVLFGSRARGDHRPDSDYDLLIVVVRREEALLDVLYDAVIDVLLLHGRLISLKVLERRELARLEVLGTPFITRVAAEGIRVG